MEDTMLGVAGLWLRGFSVRGVVLRRGKQERVNAGFEL